MQNACFLSAQGGGWESFLRSGGGASSQSENSWEKGLVPVTTYDLLAPKLPFSAGLCDAHSMLALLIADPEGQWKAREEKDLGISIFLFLSGPAASASPAIPYARCQQQVGSALPQMSEY